MSATRGEGLKPDWATGRTWVDLRQVSEVYIVSLCCRRKPRNQRTFETSS
jgi:hypothetical protein